MGGPATRDGCAAAGQPIVTARTAAEMLGAVSSIDGSIEAAYRTYEYESSMKGTARLYHH